MGSLTSIPSPNTFSKGFKQVPDFLAPLINATEIQIKQRTVGNGLVIKGDGIGMGTDRMDVV